jgi:hypothetical protein
MKAFLLAASITAGLIGATNTAGAQYPTSSYSPGYGSGYGYTYPSYGYGYGYNFHYPTYGLWAYTPRRTAPTTTMPRGPTPRH